MRLYTYHSITYQDKTVATVWENLEDETMYKELDLPEFEQMFSAYQRKDGVKEVVLDNKKKEVKVSLLLEIKIKYLFPQHRIVSVIGSQSFFLT